MAGKDLDLRIMLAAIIGFVAFSMPLLIHDLGFVDLRPGSQQQQDALPPPPPYHYEQYNEDTPSHEFRTYIQEGKLEEAEQLFAKSMAEDPQVNLATKSHWHGSTPLFEAARSGNLAVAKWLVSKGADTQVVVTNTKLRGKLVAWG